MPKKKGLTQMEIDQLAEIANIGGGNASTALSHMLGKKVNMTVPESYTGDIQQIQRLLGSADDEVLALFLKMYGDIDGAMAMIFTPKSALQFVQLLTKTKHKKLADLHEMDQSALREVGNVLLGASITALSKFLDLNITYTIPDIAIDMLGAVMDSILLEVSQGEDKILSFKINLSIDGKKVGGDLYYLFDPISSAKILKINNKKI